MDNNEKVELNEEVTETIVEEKKRSKKGLIVLVILLVLSQKCIFIK